MHKKSKYPTSAMVWFGICNEGLTRHVIIESGAINNKVYIEKILHVALGDGKKIFGNEFTFQQDNATTHTHTHKNTQSWCNNHFYDFWQRIIGHRIVMILAL